jgi:hypothetical protein
MTIRDIGLLDPIRPVRMRHERGAASAFDQLKQRLASPSCWALQ